MNKCKLVAGLAVFGALTGCTSLTTTRKPVVDEKVVIQTVNGVSTTNTTTSVEMKPEYNTAAKYLNGVKGFGMGIIGGAMAGHEMGTNAPEMENANFLQKTGHYFSSLGEGMWTGAKLGAQYGYNRSLVEEEKAAQAAALEKYTANQGR